MLFRVDLLAPSHTAAFLALLRLDGSELLNIGNNLQKEASS